tara:strand:- start:56 stop:208 length:153 start_codon:yes stop_codon:yes gene_type:complete
VLTSRFPVVDFPDPEKPVKKIVKPPHRFPVIAVIPHKTVEDYLSKKIFFD